MQRLSKIIFTFFPVVYQASCTWDIRTMLELKDALRQLDRMDYRDGNGTFSIVFMTCNRDKITGGEMIELNEANRCGLPPTCKGHEMRGVRCAETGKKYAVHNRLMFRFNREEIFWV